jgi:adenylate kinase family enzyme
VKKVLLIGPGGAGKSTLARQLAARTSLPVVHLDSLFWRPGWTRTPAAEWNAAVLRELSREAWIMDGNYGGTLDMRLASCDTVVLLDLPPWLCLWRAIRRRVQFHRSSRPDMTPGCEERLEASYLWWILTYRARRLPRLRAKLECARRQGKQVFVLRSRKAVAAFLEHTRSSH